MTNHINKLYESAHNDILDIHSYWKAGLISNTERKTFQYYRMNRLAREVSNEKESQQ